MKITNVNQLKEGDTIIVLKKPVTWASRLNGRCPLHYVNFPYTLTIQKIDKTEKRPPMTCGGYGWSLTSIVEAGCELVKTTKERTEIDMKVVKTKEVIVNGVKREVTIVAVIENGEVISGYSVRLPEDKENKELAEKIALGRARKEKTNLTPDSELGEGLQKKYIIHAIVDNLFLKIERGVIKIKGVK